MNSNALVALLVAAAMITIPIGALAADGASPVGASPVRVSPGDDSPDDVSQVNEDGTENATVAPGQKMSGIVDVGEAEVEGEIEARTFGIKVAQAKSENATADIVREELDTVEERLNDLEERKQALDRARENGSISEGEYRARVTGMAAQTANVKRLANASANVSQGLPTDLLEARGINASAIQTLQDRAGELSGPEVAEIARGIAGEKVGDRPGRPGAGDRGGQPDAVPGGQPTDAPGGQSTDVPAGQPTGGGDEPTDSGTVRTSPTNTTSAPHQGSI